MRRQFELLPHQEIRISDLFPGIVTLPTIRFERIVGDLHLRTYYGLGDNTGVHSISIQIGEKTISDKSQYFMSHGGCVVICYV